MDFEYKNQAVETPDQKREKLASKSGTTLIEALGDTVSKVWKKIKFPLKAGAVIGTAAGLTYAAVNSGSNVKPTIEQPAKSVDLDQNNPNNAEILQSKKDLGDKLKGLAERGIGEKPQGEQLGENMTLSEDDKPMDKNVVSEVAE